MYFFHIFWRGLGNASAPDFWQNRRGANGVTLARSFSPQIENRPTEHVWGKARKCSSGARSFIFQLKEVRRPPPKSPHFFNKLLGPHFITIHPHKTRWPGRPLVSRHAEDHAVYHIPANWGRKFYPPINRNFFLNRGIPKKIKNRISQLRFEIQRCNVEGCCILFIPTPDIFFRFFRRGLIYTEPLNFSSNITYNIWDISNTLTKFGRLNHSIGLHSEDFFQIFLTGGLGNASAPNLWENRVFIFDEKGPSPTVNFREKTLHSHDFRESSEGRKRWGKPITHTWFFRHILIFIFHDIHKVLHRQARNYSSDTQLLTCN